MTPAPEAERNVPTGFTPSKQTARLPVGNSITCRPIWRRERASNHRERVLRAPRTLCRLRTDSGCTRNLSHANRSWAPSPEGAPCFCGLIAWPLSSRARGCPGRVVPTHSFQPKAAEAFDFGGRQFTRDWNLRTHQHSIPILRLAPVCPNRQVATRSSPVLLANPLDDGDTDVFEVNHVTLRYV